MVEDTPCIILKNLEQRWYRIVAIFANVNQSFNSYIWTLFKPEEIGPLNGYDMKLSAK